MKNLVQLGERRRRVTLPNGASSPSIVDLCHVLTEEVDSDEATVVLTNDGLLSRITGTGDILWTCNLEELKAGGGWFDVSYIDPELVCLSKHGAIVTVSPSNGEAELVGVFDFGLEAAAWSPDGEVLLMVTSTADEEDENETNSVLLSMNSQFEVLAEIIISPYISASNAPGARISVAWRPDGSLCAVSSVDKADNTRKVRIYKRETLELHAIGRSEDASGSMVKNLQDTDIAWASSGCSQLLAGVQRKGKRTIQVVFFESNGLRHREFVLREAPTTTVPSLAWNVNSDLLAVALRDESGTDRVQLWHRCNYHWYLKREIRYPGRRIERIKFNEEHSSEFYILLDSLEWREYEIRWDPSTTLQVSGACPAFVVDGCFLNITPLEKALIPPPMYMSRVNMEFPICDIFFCHHGNLAGHLFVSLSDGTLVYLSPTDGKYSLKPLKIVWGDSKDIDLMSLRSFLVMGTEIDQLQLIAIACAKINHEQEKLVEITVSHLDTAEPTANVTSSSTLEGHVLRMVQWSDSPKGSLLEMQDGSLLEYEASEQGGIILPSEAGPLLEPCPWICGIKEASAYNDVEHTEGHSRLVFGLSTRLRLYYHDLMLTDSASSFFLSTSHEYLCYATSGSRCQLKFLPFKEISNFDPLMGLDHNHVLEGYEPRNVERGSRIVAILPSQPMAVLQMPRGNLEGIYPRALVLRSVMKRIIDGDYGNAFRAMRKHKVDLNLLVDFDPCKFMENGLESFIDQVPNIDHLNLFLSGLQDWDITQTRFPIPAWFPCEKMGSKESSLFDFSSKVNQVCAKARSTMLQIEKDRRQMEGHFLLPVLSTFAKERPPRLDEALSLIKENALKHHPTNSKKPPLFSDKAQHSIHYLAFLAEYKLLFETALGMYDYDLARAVARNSQMDPKVYLPLLKRLKTLPTYYARYEVDIRLKRFDLALKNLFESYSKEEDTVSPMPDDNDMRSAGNEFENCMSLIEEHGLYQLGLDLFRNDTSKKHRIYVSLGEYLLREKRSETALCVFLAADPPCIEGAKRAARASGDWESYFAMVEEEEGLDISMSPEQIGIKDEKRRQLAREVADEIVGRSSTSALKTKRRVRSDAARILLDYGNDLNGAVDMLIQGQCWSELHRISALHSRTDMVKRCTDAALSYAHGALSTFEDNVSEFEAANKRYAEVLKARKQQVFIEGPTPAEEDDTGSLFSAASNLSNMSLRSNTSTSSTGTGVSSIISVKSTTTFTMTGDDGVNRHRSKFNKGKKQKKPRKKKKNRKQNIEAELKSLVGTLRSACADLDYAQVITETIQYLVFVQQVPLATELFQSYNKMCDSISNFRTERIAATEKEQSEAERNSRMEGEQFEENHILVKLPIEKEMDELSCAELPQSLRDFFTFS